MNAQAPARDNVRLPLPNRAVERQIQFLAELSRIETLFDAGQILFLRNAVGRRKQRRRFGCEPLPPFGVSTSTSAPPSGSNVRLNVASRRTSRPPRPTCETIFVARRTAETDERQPLGARIIGTVLVIPVEYARQRGESAASHGRIFQTTVSGIACKSGCRTETCFPSFR